MMNDRNFLKNLVISVSSLLGMAVHTAAPPVEAAEAAGQPNFVVIFVDDMGYGDIEPFGSTLNKTPHLNRMASEGIKLTSFYVAAPVCTPSRAALMTGCYPKRVGLATGSVYSVLLAVDAHGLNPEERTIARILQDAGYATGCFGKWHLGDQPEFLPTRHGFETFFGIPYSNDIWPYHPRPVTPYPPLALMRNEEVVDTVADMDAQAQLCKLFTDEATAFIKENRDRPFFVYLPHAFTHHPRNARQEFMDRAGAGRLWDESRMARDQKYGMRQRTRAQIEEIDWSVGEILSCLRELGLERNTLVLFTSDNGGTSGNSNAPLKGGKGRTTEGGMREPTIVWWPGTTPAGATCDAITTSMDLLPTFAGLGGGKVPEDRVIDGKDIGPLLLGAPGAKSPHEAFFYYRREQLEAVRRGEWKLRTSGELYHLLDDIGETMNVAQQHPAVVQRLNEYLEKCRADLDNPKHCRAVGKIADPQPLVPFASGE